jgi:hypothetical protein
VFFRPLVQATHGFSKKEVNLVARGFDDRTLKLLIDSCGSENDEPELEWKQVHVDEEIVNVDGNEEIIAAETVTRLPRKKRRPVPRHVPSPGFRYPVWEKRVRLIGEARLDIGENEVEHPVRIVPIDVYFSSPPTLDRLVIVCGFVWARIHLGRQPARPIALPFQATYPAWPVRDHDRVVEDLLNFAGNRVCPILVTAPNGRIHRALELKVAFDANIKVFRQPRRRGPRCQASASCRRKLICLFTQTCRQGKTLL